MIVTLPFLEKKFDEFNRLIFGGKLPIPIFMPSRARTLFGQCVCHKNRDQLGRVIGYEHFELRFSLMHDLPETDWEDIVIHEMIHYYIGYNRLKDKSSHGPLFCQLMNDINQRYGRHITISRRAAAGSTPAQTAQTAQPRPPRCHVLAVVTFCNGRTGIKLLPRVLPSILSYYNGLMRVRGADRVDNIRLYMVCHAWFERYPVSSALRIHYVDPQELQPYLKDAERLECDGRRLLRPNK